LPLLPCLLAVKKKPLLHPHLHPLPQLLPHLLLTLLPLPLLLHLLTLLPLPLLLLHLLQATRSNLYFCLEKTASGRFFYASMLVERGATHAASLSP
jgi:hypothetical protein